MPRVWQYTARTINPNELKRTKSAKLQNNHITNKKRSTYVDVNLTIWPPQYIVQIYNRYNEVLLVSRYACLTK